MSPSITSAWAAWAAVVVSFIAIAIAIRAQRKSERTAFNSRAQTHIASAMMSVSNCNHAAGKLVVCIQANERAQKLEYLGDAFDISFANADAALQVAYHSTFSRRSIATANQINSVSLKMNGAHKDVAYFFNGHARLGRAEREEQARACISHWNLVSEAQEKLYKLANSELPVAGAQGD